MRSTNLLVRKNRFSVRWTLTRPFKVGVLKQGQEDVLVRRRHEGARLDLGGSTTGVGVNLVHDGCRGNRIEIRAGMHEDRAPGGEQVLPFIPGLIAGDFDFSGFHVVMISDSLQRIHRRHCVGCSVRVAPAPARTAVFRVPQISPHWSIFRDAAWFFAT